MNGAQLRCHTTGPDDTRALAGAVAALFREGDVVALTGELGAGKTCFVQGAAAQLGVDSRVVSPTFMLMRSYRGAQLDIVHVDVYRLDNLAEVRDLGEDVFANEVVTFVEWGDAVEPLLPEDRLEVELLLGSSLEEREVQLRGHGTWERRLVAELADAVADWTIREDA